MPGSFLGHFQTKPDRVNSRHDVEFFTLKPFRRALGLKFGRLTSPTDLAGYGQRGSHRRL